MIIHGVILGLLAIMVGSMIASVHNIGPREYGQMASTMTSRAIPMVTMVANLSRTIRAMWSACIEWFMPTHMTSDEYRSAKRQLNTILTVVYVIGFLAWCVRLFRTGRGL